MEIDIYMFCEFQPPVSTKMVDMLFNSLVYLVIHSFLH